MISKSIKNLNVKGDTGASKKHRRKSLWPRAQENFLKKTSAAAPRQRNMARMKEQSKASEREVSEEEIANLSDGEFKALVIKMLTHLIELGWKMKKKKKER